MALTAYCSDILGAISAFVDTLLFPEDIFNGKSDLYSRDMDPFLIPKDLSILFMALIASERYVPDITSCTLVCVDVLFHIFKDFLKIFLSK